eukprot:12395928-Heterocapsa_arctica.AAC.1
MCRFRGQLALTPSGWPQSRGSSWCRTRASEDAVSVRPDPRCVEELPAAAGSCPSPVRSHSVPEPWSCAPSS